jgi:hypothetical protein
MTKLEYACEVLVEHNLQVEILFPMKQGGNIYLLGINIASWQHYTKCLFHYVVKFWVIVYLLPYTISMITISEKMKTVQHHGLVDIGHHFESVSVAKQRLGWPLWNICVINDHGYISMVASTSRSFLVRDFFKNSN